MKINSYAVAMNAQYFNLKQENLDVTTSTSSNNFQSADSTELSKIELHSENDLHIQNALDKELSKAILKNIEAESNRSIRDTVEMSYNYTENQALNFQVQAVIQTQSKEMEISLDISLSRSFTQKINLNVESLRVLKDPLVLSFNEAMPSVSDKTFSFDIDSDGARDQISQLSAGNGFLALDKNSNGIIDNGGELFGTKSGDGFSDLRLYDDDNNGWIDKNDVIFDKLRIWKKSDTQNELIALGELGVGAIFLGNSTTPFELKSDSNQLLAEIKSSGFFVYENGRAGVISQVDLAVTKETQNNLERAESLQNDITTSKLNSAYAKEIDDTKDSDDTRIEKLQEQLKVLENKLLHAKDAEKPALQAQIGTLFSQMMSILEEEFR